MEKSPLNFCTLFDSNFLIRGLAMYQSLATHETNFHLYVFAFDEKSWDILTRLQLPDVTVVSLEKFEDPELLAVKPTRSVIEYCWTTTPSIILYAIERFGLDACTYLDADLFFFASPRVLLAELGEDSILITEHRYAPGQDKTLTSGKYCVQFNTFKNNPAGLTALRWWRDRCIEWCYAKLEDGKFGDQKYLDDWPQRFVGVHELQHFGGGVAPWNVARYEFSKNNGEVLLKETEAGKSLPLIFYHFHSTRLYHLFGKIRTKSYYLVNTNSKVRKFIYQPYEIALVSALETIRTADSKFNLGFTSLSRYVYDILQEIIPGIIKTKLKKLLR